MANQPSTDIEEHFFLPNFCETRSVFLVILIGEMLALLIALSRNFTDGRFWSNLGLISLTIQWIALSSTGLLCILRPYLAQFTTVIAGCFSYGLILVITLLFTIVSLWVFYDVTPASYHLHHYSVVFRNLLISAIVTAMALRYFYLQQQYRLRLQTESEARIQALQSRIHPHFLFNSMNIIASLTRTNPELAEHVVEDLSELFRASLDKAGRMVTLEEEIQLCKRYVGIEQLRLGKRLDIQWRIEGDTYSVAIPLLTLQPLLENAIYHGIEPLTDGGQIRVVVEQQQQRTTITIANPFPVLEKGVKRKSGNQIALDNIQERLNVIFKGRASLTAQFSDEIYIVTLQLPNEESL